MAWLFYKDTSRKGYGWKFCSHTSSVFELKSFLRFIEHLKEIVKISLHRSPSLNLEL